MPTPHSADDIRRFIYPYLKAGLIIVFSLLTGAIAGLVARAFEKPWWDCLTAVLAVTGGTTTLLFAAGGYIATIQANRAL
jgi:hypothetical protein